MKVNEAPEKLYFGEVDKGLLDIYWVDYGGKCLCGKIYCARVNRKDPNVWCIVGGLNNLKRK